MLRSHRGIGSVMRHFKAEAGRQQQQDKDGPEASMMSSPASAVTVTAASSNAPHGQLRAMAAEAEPVGARAVAEEDLALLLVGASAAESRKHSKEEYEEAWARFELMEMERLSPAAEIALMADELQNAFPHHDTNDVR